MSSFIRLNITAEGQTEERFIKQVLASHLGNFNISTDVRRVLTSKKKLKTFRGGLSTYKIVKRDIENWLKEDNNSEVRFSTMFDLYALPNDFPGYEEAQKKAYPYEKVETLEEHLKDDINDHRFIPYIQLHEFEAMVLAQPEQIALEYFDQQEAIRALKELLENHHGNPELIDEGVETAPSKQIIKVIPEYADNKASTGPILVKEIGVGHLKATCPHFKQWIDSLEALSK